MSSHLHIREARKDEIPALVQLAARAFRGRPMTEALFPGHLKQANPHAGLESRARLHYLKFDEENLHYIVVADDEDKAVGSAAWQSPSQLSAEELEARKEKLRAARMESTDGMDLAAHAEIEKAVKVLDKINRDALGEDGYKNAWYLDALAVDPAHQRRGIGKMLVQWGQDRADEEHRNVHFLSSEAGSKLYRSLGYEELGYLDICGGREYAFIKRAS